MGNLPLLPPGASPLVPVHAHSDAYSELMTQQEGEEWRALFDSANLSEKGFLARQGLGLVLRSTGATFTSAELTEMIAFADIKRNKEIGFRGFAVLMMRRKRQAQLEAQQLEGQSLEDSASRMLRLVHRLRLGGRQLARSRARVG